MHAIHSSFRRYPIVICLLAILTIPIVAGCGSENGGTTPTQFGAVEGLVRLPFKLAASGEPIAGVSVRITSGDFDTVTTTNESGEFLVDQIPARRAELTAEFSACLATDGSVVVRADDTSYIELTLDSHSDFDTISVGWAGASRIEIDQTANRAILLYDAATRGGNPGIGVVDLTTGESNHAELSDLDDVFDVEIINSNQIVFNYTANGTYGLRFYDPVSMAPIGSDVPYPSASVQQIDHDGRLALDANREHVFVTHAVREGIAVFGKVYAVSIAQQTLTDADNDIFNGEFAFDANLVENSLDWAYNIAFDNATNEILIGNRITATVTAVDWDMWGFLDRDDSLAVPTSGVRVVDMNPPPPNNDDLAFGVEIWSFAGGFGIGTKDLPGKMMLLQYESGADAWSEFHLEPVIAPSTTNHVLTIVPERQSWFIATRDQDRDFVGVIRAIEERSSDNLERLYRYESRYIETATPRALAVDADAHLLYVSYNESSFLEVFCLP